MGNIYRLRFSDYIDSVGQLKPGEVEWGEDDLIDFLQQYPGNIIKLEDNSIRLLLDTKSVWKPPYLSFDIRDDFCCIFKSINGTFTYNRDETIEELVKRYLDEKYQIETQD